MQAKKSKKGIVFIVAVAACLAIAVGGVFMYLTASTSQVKNTFTVGNIDITLEESADLDLKMVPGATITKDPVVTVEADSEACYLFVEIEKSANFDTFMTFTNADGWTALTGVDGVYYRTVSTSTSDQAFHVLANDQVQVKGTVTKAQMDALTDATLPTLAFTAYAVQQEGFSTAAAAWAEL